jgi:DNA repair exonuclease SbcCD ATPase subunit
MSRTRMRVKARDKKRELRRGSCEVSRALKLEQAEAWAEYSRMVRAGAACPICGHPLVNCDELVSISVMTDRGIVHESCA